MSAIHLHRIVEADGEITLKGLPFKKGQSVELLLLPGNSSDPSPSPRLTARQLRRSALIGLWRDRKEIKDSAEYARELRQQAQQRRG